jgi:hypothetical protein
MMNAGDMNDAQWAARDGLSVLSLQLRVTVNPAGGPIRILVDGQDLCAAVNPGWLGFSPAEMLGPRSPLLPTGQDRRVAVCYCSCGMPECGVIAPLIVTSPDWQRVSWTDFRKYVAVFEGPVADSVNDDDGIPWDLPDLHFDRKQYVAEVKHASKALSQETDR